MSDETQDGEIEKIEEELKRLEDGELPTDGYGSPTPEKKDSTLVLFRELIDREDSKKFANLSNQELGPSKLGVRHLLDIGLFSESQGLTELGKYFEKKAEIILATSLSRQGKLIDNIVTQIKKEQKLKTPTDETKKKWFSLKPKEEVSVE